MTPMISESSNTPCIIILYSHCAWIVTADSFPDASYEEMPNLRLY